MSRLPSCTAADVIRALKRAGLFADSRASCCGDQSVTPLG